MVTQLHKLETATVIAEANIAFVKHWGLTEQGLPITGSLSMNLAACTSQTTTTPHTKAASKDEIKILTPSNTEAVYLDPETSTRNLAAYELVKKIKSSLGFNGNLEITSTNNFPTSAGIASSASGFCALTLSVINACGHNWQTFSKDKLVEMVSWSGSYSAVRSLGQSIVKLNCENNSLEIDEVETDLELVDLIAVVDSSQKDHSSLDGHLLAATSPIFKARCEQTKRNLELCSKALINNNFSQFKTICEQEALMLHSVMLTSLPALIYLKPASLDLIEKLHKLCNNLEFAYTIDAGPNIHIICQKQFEPQLTKILKTDPTIKELITSPIGKGPRNVT